MKGELSDQEETLSWFGKHGNLTWNETFALLHHQSNDNVSFVLEEQKVYDNITEMFVITIGGCKVFEGQPVKKMEIEFQDTSGRYIVYVSDPTANNHFQIPFSLGLGVDMYIKFHENTNIVKAYRIQLKETTVETDVACLNYPTAKFKTYSDCIDQEVRRGMLHSLGCMVPWMSNRDQCTSPVQRKTEHKALIESVRSKVDDAYGGMEFRADAACPRPCSLVSAYSRYASFSTGYKTNTLVLQFDEDILVENITLAYAFTDLLVEIGSGLGLWLGKGSRKKILFLVAQGVFFWYSFLELQKKIFLLRLP